MLASPSDFFVTGGTLPPDALSYVERAADRELWEALRRSEFCYILTSRQMGKSSLMVRTAVRLHEEGAAVAVLDLTALGQNLTPAQWYRGMISLIGQRLGLEQEMVRRWRELEDHGPVQRLMRILREVVLEQIPGPVVVFVDEIDIVRSLPFIADEFFAAVRECYNRRQHDEVLHRLTFCLIGVATPSDLIRDTRSTPFNVGRRIELSDFSQKDAAPLRVGLVMGGPGTRMRSTEEANTLLGRVLHWTGGHPYLTQRLCAALAHHSEICDERGVDEQCRELFLAPATHSRDDNLQFVHDRLLGGEHPGALLELYLQVLRGRRVQDDTANPVVEGLRLSGIVKVTGRHLEVRNRIYTSVFDAAWVTACLPDAELRRQRAAYRRGVLRGSLLAALVIALGLATTTAVVQEVRNRQLAEEGKRREVSRSLENGAKLLDDEDWFGALVWYAEAARMEREDRSRSEVHALRINTILSMCPRLEQTFTHGGRIWDVAFSPDGKRIATAGYDGTARIWNVLRGELSAPALAHGAWVGHVRFSPDGSRVLTSSGDGTARVWVAATGRLALPPLRHRGRVTYAEFSPDGRWIATSGADSTARLWHAASGRAACAPLRHSGNVNHLEFSPDGKTLVTASSDGTARLWRLDGTSLGPPMAHDGPVLRVRFSPDGGKVASASSDESATVWQLSGTPRRLARLWHADRVSDVRFSPDGKLVATASNDGTARVWQAGSGKPVTRPLPHGAKVEEVQFSPDGRQISTAGRDHAVRLWDLPSGRIVAPLLPHSDEVSCARFSRDGRWLLSASRDGTARLWDLRARGVRPLVLRPNPKPIRRIRFSPDGRLLASGGYDGAARLWDAASGAPSGAPLHHSVAVEDMAFSSDGRKLVTAGFDRTAAVWDLSASAQSAVRLVHPAPVIAVAFSPDGSRVVTGCSDGTARLWQASTAQPLTPLMRHSGRINVVRFSADGERVLTCSEDGTAQAWEARTGRPVGRRLTAGAPLVDAGFAADPRFAAAAGRDGLARTWDLTTGRELAIPHRGGVQAALFTPGDRYLLTASGGLDDFDEGRIELWDPVTGRKAAEPMLHRGRVALVRLNRIGTILASGTVPGDVRLWDAVASTPIAAPFHHPGLLDVDIDARGTRIASAGVDGAIRVWSLPSDPINLLDAAERLQALAARRVQEGRLEPLPLTPRVERAAPGSH